MLAISEYIGYRLLASVSDRVDPSRFIKTCREWHEKKSIKKYLSLDRLWRKLLKNQIHSKTWFSFPLQWAKHESVSFGFCRKIRQRKRIHQRRWSGGSQPSQHSTGKPWLSHCNARVTSSCGCFESETILPRSRRLLLLLQQNMY